MEHLNLEIIRIQVGAITKHLTKENHSIGVHVAEAI